MSDDIEPNDDDEHKIVSDAPPPPLPPRDVFGLIEGSKSPIGVLETLLKCPKRLYTEVREGERSQVLLGLALVCLVSLIGYGLIAGAFSGGKQMLYAPIKITLGLLFSGLICLPSLYIFICLGQVEAKFSEVVIFLMAMITLVAVMLVGLAPVMFVFTMSTDSLAFMGFLHLAFWAVAARFGYRFFMNVFAYMTGKTDDRGYMAFWMLILTFVVLQMSTALRPLIGSSSQVLSSKKVFFVTHWIEQMF